MWSCGFVMWPFYRAVILSNVQLIVKKIIVD